jgi:transmembrane sensor
MAYWHPLSRLRKTDEATVKSSDDRRGISVEAIRRKEVTVTDREAPSPETLRREATRWVTWLHSGEITEEERRVFAGWLAESEAHRQAYREAEAFWQDLEQFRPSLFPELEAARSRPGSGRQRSGGKPRRPWGKSLLRGGLAALGLVLTILGIAAVSDRGVYETAIGEQRAITLEDGSGIALNTDTRLRVDFSGATRTVHLDRGEAVFTVSHADPRPFEVVAGNGLIRDIGTRFDVRRQDDHVSVIVIEGSVKVATNSGNIPLLSRGERVSYHPTEGISAIESADPATATEWLHGRISFKEKPLGEVVEEMTRYHDVRVIFADPALSVLKVSGSFGIQDLDQLLDCIGVNLSLQVQREGNRRIVIARQPGTLQQHPARSLSSVR